MSKRWGVWMRLSVVLTVLWLLTAPIAGCMHARSQWVDANAYAFATCFNDRLTPLPERQSCIDGANSQEFAQTEVYISGLITAAIMVAVAWGLGIVARFTTRWVLAGREQV